MTFLASGITPDGLFNGTVALFIAALSTVVSVVLSIRDRRSVRSEAQRQADENQKRFDELTTRMDVVRDAQVKRVDAMWRDRIADFQQREAGYLAEIQSLRGAHG